MVKRFSARDGGFEGIVKTFGTLPLLLRTKFGFADNAEQVAQLAVCDKLKLRGTAEVVQRKDELKCPNDTVVV